VLSHDLFNDNCARRALLIADQLGAGLLRHAGVTMHGHGRMNVDLRRAPYAAGRR